MAEAEPAEQGNEPPAVRLRYATIVNYAAILFRLAASIGFSVIVARRLPPAEYGVWGTMVALANALITPLTLIRLWPPREEAWGWRGSGFTGLLAASGYSLVSMLFFAAGMSLLLHGEAGWPLIGVVLPLAMGVYAYLRNLAVVAKPESGGYSMLVYEAVRLPSVYLLVAELRLGLAGA